MPSEKDILQGFLQEPPESDLATEEAVDFDPDDPEEEEDGSALVEIGDKKDTARALEFYDNLAEDMQESDLNGIANDILDLLDKDKEARGERDKKYAEGIQRTGLGQEAPGGASFKGASKVTHPLLLEVCIDFAARAVKELWPAEGPAKDKIIGKPTQKKEDKAKRKVGYMNWQLTEKMPSTRREIEQILSQVPLGGVQYSKLSYDKRRKKPVHEPVWVDNVLLPEAATDYYSSDRKSHEQYLTKYTFKDRIRSGMYRDVDTIADADPDRSAASKASDAVEGKQKTSFNEDGVRLVHEVSIQYVIKDAKRGVSDLDKDDKGPAPYLISVDESTRRVLSIYRNWDEDDENEEELQHIVEWPFIPWRGAMPIGIPQILGGIAAAATGALRSLLDSAHINNFPGGMRLKSGPMGGQAVSVGAAETNEIQGSINQDDVRKMFLPTPLNPTSPVLMELLQFLVEAGKEVVKTTLDESNDNANVPVGTTMARIEQGMIVFSAIHSRLHDSMGKFLKILHRINATYLDDDQVVDETGEKMTFKADFDSPMDVVPVSDPEIFSELQRVAQIQTIAQRAMVQPALYDARKVEEGILKHMKIKDATSYLVAKPEPKPLNSVNENIAASLGQPIVAFPDQDHLAHIQSHMKFLEDPTLGQNPLIAAQAIPGLLQNIKEHMLFQYATEIHALASKAAGQDISEFMSIKDTLVKTEFDKMLAAASNAVAAQTQQLFGGIMPGIQKCQQVLQSYQPPQPMDPSQVAQQKVQADTQSNQAKNQIAQQKLQLDAQGQQSQAQVDAQKLALQKAESDQAAQAGAQQTQADLAQGVHDNQTKLQATDMTVQGHTQGIQSQNATKLEVTAQDNRVAEEIAFAEIAAGHKSNIKNGQAVGKKQSQ